MELKFESGLIPAIVQEKRSGKVLMLGYMNQEAYHQTVRTGYVTFYSRSRQQLWMKGETSGHRLRLSELRVDCDGDALLVQADLTGPGCCHLGYRSCFFTRLTPEGKEIIAEKAFDPGEVYKGSDD